MPTDDEEQQSSAGGAATNAGVEFQQRVAAWCLVLMHCASDPKALLDLPDTGSITTVRFEAKTPIDDVVLVTERDREILIQAKRRVSLSEAAGSDFVSTLDQFVSQYAAHPDAGYYVLAVPPDTSGRIRNTFRKLLDALRLNPDAWRDNPLSKSDETCIAIYRAVLQQLFRGRGLVFDERTILAFSRRVFVRELAVTAGLGHETAALTLLGRDARVAPELLWSYLIGQSLRFAAKRASVTRASLGELIAPYFAPGAAATPELSMKLAVKVNGAMPAGREVILVKGFVKDDALSIMEFYRFDEDGRKRLRFKGDIAFWNDDVVPDGSKLLHRSATMAGMKRWIKDHVADFAGQDVYIMAANDIEAEVHSAFAKAHSALLERMASEAVHLLSCVHCGKPMSQAWMTMVELDDENNPPGVGPVHDGCLQPADRVIGQANCPEFEGREYLKKFDVNRWIELRLHGQGAFNASVGTRTGAPAFIGWNPKNEGFRQDSYCVEISLSDGTTRHATSRSSLDRYNLEEATKRAKFMDSRFKKSIQARDPDCYTSVNFTYGPESLLLRIKEPDESLLECREARVVPYTPALGRRYQQDLMFYAPLCRLVSADDEKPVLLRGCQLVLTDPFRLPDLMQTWRNAALEIPDYEIRILETDNDVDRWFGELLSAGEEPVIDPICDRDGNLVGGFFVHDVSKLLNPWD